ncbi:MAG: biopolymer transporter ExbD [Chromatiales bacterium 21-64-14]|nr:MAG: biopolymer transporter ExbD [Chromatiales bacterium 21-64-14]HQU15945.1 biopolymer transporter ExbD [Gammaproteobacteria bacterium]
MKRRKSREFRRGRIEIIPMIDVMFFLLATFMLASLTMQNLHSLPVNLPKGKAETMQTEEPVTLTVTEQNRIFVNHTPVTVDTLATTLKPLLKGTDPAVIVSADRAARNGVVVRAMLAARQAGANRFLIAIKRP